MAKQSKKKASGKGKTPVPPPSRWAAHRPLYERLFFVVALLGVLVTAHFNLTASTGFEQECLFGAFESQTEVSGCQAALESAVGRPFGVSNAVWGMLFYLLVAGLCVAVVFSGEARRLLWKRTRAALVGFGFLYSAFLTGYQFVAMPARCPLCLISALLVAVLLGVQLLYLYQPLDPSTRIMKATKKVREGAFYGALTALALLLLSADAVYFNNLDTLVEPAAAQTTQPPRNEVSQPTADTNAAGDTGGECGYDLQKAPVPNLDALIGDRTPLAGNTDAAVILIEFFDPNCPHCRALHPVMKAVMEAHADQVRFVYKPIWLPQFPYSVRQNAVLFAAAEAGKFREMLDLQFEGQQRGGLSMDQLKELALEVGMDPDAMQERIEAGHYDALINGGNQEALDAGVTGVPSVIINGLFVAGNSRTEACLNQLIEAELEGAGAEG